ncbi:MAG: glycosyltransferase [Bacteroidales bacterium]|nr:glycosyltransferase [Bacteroidales bacterium]
MANSSITVLEGVLIGLIGLYFVRIIITYVISQYYFAQNLCPDSSGYYTPKISVIKSIWGLDDYALDNFRSFCEQDYPNDYEIVFCVENRTDPAIPLISKVISEYPERDIRLIFSDPEDRRRFGKIKNMIAGLMESKYEVIMFSDSDVHAPKTFIRKSVRCFNNPKTGLAFNPPLAEGAEDWTAAMLNMAVNENTINLALLYFFIKGFGAVGTTMTIRKKVIDEIGGLDQFGRQVTDDIPLARAIYKKGYGIHLLKEPARIYHPHDNFGEWWQHMVRWMVMIRRYKPCIVYLAFLTDLPFLLSILYLSISENTLFGLCLVCGVLFFRLGFSSLINLTFVRDKKFLKFIWAVPVMDLLKLPLFIHACFTNNIVWRGRKMRVNRDGSVS